MNKNKMNENKMNKGLNFYSIPLVFRYHNPKFDETFYSDRDYNNNLSLFFKDAEIEKTDNIMIYTGLRDINNNRIFTGDIVEVIVTRERYDRNYNTRSKYDGLYMVKAEVIFDEYNQKFKFSLLPEEKERISKLKQGETSDRDVNFWSDNLIHNLMDIKKNPERNKITYGKGYQEVFDQNNTKIKIDYFTHCKIVDNINHNLLESEVSFPYGEKTEI